MLPTILVAIVVSYLPAAGVGLAGDDLNWYFSAVRAAADPMTVLRPEHSFYRPTEQLFFLLGYLAGGAAFAPFFVGSLVLHLVATWLVLRLARDLTLDHGAACVATAWWGLHRFHTEVVIRPYGVADSLMLVFGLLAFDLARRRGSWPAVLVTFSLCLGSKENAIVLPLLMLAWLWLGPRSADRRPQLARVGAVAVLAAAAAVGVAFLRHGSDAYLDFGPVAMTTAWENVLSWVGPDLHYLRHVILGGTPVVPVWLAAILTIGVLATLPRLSRRAGFAVLWTAVMMAPTVFVPVQAPRYQYVPMVGAALAVAVAIAAIRRRLSRDRTGYQGLVAISVGAVILSLGYNVAGIGLETSDYVALGELHTQAAESFARDALPALLETPGAVAVFSRPDPLAWTASVRRVWDRHRWWSPTCHKILYHRPYGILGMSNTWAFVTWAATGHTDHPLFVVVPPRAVTRAAAEGRLWLVVHDAPHNRFSVVPPSAAGAGPMPSELERAWLPLQPGRFDPKRRGTLYPHRVTGRASR